MKDVYAMTHNALPTTPPHLTATWNLLLPLIGSGLSLPAALAQLPDPKPSIWILKRSVRLDPDLERRYSDALEARADALADEIASLVDQPIPTGLRGSDASAWVQQQRLRVDTKKWLACKLFPKRWGDKVEVGIAVNQRISITAALVAADRRLELLQHEADNTSRARIGA